MKHSQGLGSPADRKSSFILRAGMAVAWLATVALISWLMNLSSAPGLEPDAPVVEQVSR